MFTKLAWLSTKKWYILYYVCPSLSHISQIAVIIIWPFNYFWLHVCVHWCTVNWGKTTGRKSCLFHPQITSDQSGGKRSFCSTYLSLCLCLCGSDVPVCFSERIPWGTVSLSGHNSLLGTDIMKGSRNVHCTYFIYVLQHILTVEHTVSAPYLIKAYEENNRSTLSHAVSCF